MKLIYTKRKIDSVTSGGKKANTCCHGNMAGKFVVKQTNEYKQFESDFRTHTFILFSLNE